MIWLPAILRLVADEASLDDALKLARARGGTRLYVPANPTEAVIREIGEPAARVLSLHYPNETITIPLGPSGSANAARRVADQAIAEGDSVATAASKSGMTERGVYLRKARKIVADQRQRRLFD